MQERFDGGPVGLDNLAASISEERETIEDVIEPYLSNKEISCVLSRARWLSGQTAFSLITVELIRQRCLYNCLNGWYP